MTKREIESGRVDIRLLRVGSPCHAPTYPALYKTSTEKHEKNIREIFENVNRQSYPSEVYLKLSTDNLTQLCTKHQQRNLKKKHKKNIGNFLCISDQSHVSIVCISFHVFRNFLFVKVCKVDQQTREAPPSHISRSLSPRRNSSYSF